MRSAGGLCESYGVTEYPQPISVLAGYFSHEIADRSVFLGAIARNCAIRGEWPETPLTQPLESSLLR